MDTQETTQTRRWWIAYEPDAPAAGKLATGVLSLMPITLLGWLWHFVVFVVVAAAAGATTQVSTSRVITIMRGWFWFAVYAWFWLMRGQPPANEQQQRGRVRIVDPTGDEGIKLPGGIRVLFETFDLILVAGTAVWVVSSYVDAFRPRGHLLGGVLILIWIAMTLKNFRPA